MAVLRSDLAGDVGETLAELLSLANVMPLDAPNGLRVPINRALWKIGTATAGPVDDADAGRALNWALYFTLIQIEPKLVLALATATDDARSAKFRDVASLKQAYLEAAKQSDGGWYSGSINYDFLEPEVC